MLSCAAQYPMYDRSPNSEVLGIALTAAAWCGTLPTHLPRSSHLDPTQTPRRPVSCSPCPTTCIPASTYPPSSQPPSSAALWSTSRSQPWPSLPPPSGASAGPAPSPSPSRSCPPCSPPWCQTRSRPFRASWSGSSPWLARSDTASGPRRRSWLGRRGWRRWAWRCPRARWGARASSYSCLAGIGRLRKL